MTPRTIVFKCAFGGADGWGHAARCSALASVFAESGWRTVLWTASDPSTLPTEIAAVFEFQEVGARLSEFVMAADALCIDEMYTSDAELSALARQWRSVNPAPVLIAIDDMQRRSLGDFDLVINTEIGLERAQYASAQSLLGERYALLRGGFRSLPAPAEWILPESVRPILVMLGGTDAFGYTARVLDALWSAEGDALAPAVVCGGGVDTSAVAQSLRRFSHGRVLERLESRDVAAWMRRCAFGVIACGTSLYEAGAADLPFAGLCLVDNQRATAEQVARRWRMPILHREGRHQEPLRLETALAALRQIPQGTKFSGIDGGGAERVFRAIAQLVEGRSLGPPPGA